MQNNMLLSELTEMGDRHSIGYVLNSDNSFYDIGYRVMKNQNGGCLLPCHRIRYNGKIKLVYFTDGYIPLSSMIKDVDAEYIGTVIGNIVHALEEVKNNGFLNIECLDIRLEKIFVDSNTLNVKLIYLPLNCGEISNVEAAMRAQLIGLIENIDVKELPEIRKILETLHDNAIPLMGISSHITMRTYERRYVAGNITDSNYVDKNFADGNSAEGNFVRTPLCLCSITGNVRLVISGNEYLIGKNREKVHGVIEGNSAISRVHCRVVQVGNKYYISDMDSANGTYVNGQRIGSDSKVEISEGTKIRLANMDFVVRR